MPKTETEQAVCAECGSDAREGTTFCYNCGSSLIPTVADVAEPELAVVENIPPAVDDKTKAALEDLAEKLRFDEDDDKKLAKAAAERKKARVNQRKSVQYTWEPSSDSSGILIALVAIVIAGLAGIVVYLTLYWR